MKRWPLGILFLAIGFVAASCGGSQSTSASTYRTEAVTRGALQVVVVASGTTVFPNVSKLTFGSNGMVEELNVRVGQAVTKGQVMVRLEASSLETQVLQARQNLLNAQKSQQDYQDTLSDVETARARATVQSAKASVAAAEDALDKAKEVTEQQKAQGESAVANGKLTLKKATQALDKVKSPMTGDDISNAQDAADAARASVRNAQAALDNAVNDVDIAQVDYDAKLADMRLQIGSVEDTYKSKFQSRYRFIPDAAKTPQENLGYEPDTTLSFPDVQTAWDTLAKVRTQQKTLQLQATNGRATAQNSLLKAQEALANAKEASAKAEARLAELLELSPLDIESKEKAVAVASANLKQAEQDLAELKAGPDPVVVQQKSSALETAKAGLQKAQADLDKLLKGPDPLVREARKLAVETAQHSLQDAQDKLAGVSIAAPFDGVVSVVNVEKGLSVGANAIAVVVVDTSQVEVNASVDEVDVTRLQSGQEATITMDAIAGLSLRGRVNTIAPTARVQQGVVSYDLSLAVARPASDGSQQRPAGASGPNRPANPRGQSGQRQAESETGSPAGQQLRLRDGMTATASILITEKADVLLVPLRAVRTVGGQRVVEVLKGDKPIQKQVQLGLSNDQFAEVVSGLTEGEKVVIPTAGTQQRQAPQGGGLGGGIPRGLR